MNRKKRTYSQQTKVATLAALERNGNNFYQTSKETGVSSQTIIEWAKEAQRREEMRVPQPVTQIDQDAPINQQLEQVARLMIRAMPERLSDANLHELARSLSIVVNTMQHTPEEKPEEEEAVSNDVYERLSRNIDRYREVRRAAGISIDPDDREGS